MFFSYYFGLIIRGRIWTLCVPLQACPSDSRASPKSAPCTLPPPPPPAPPCRSPSVHDIAILIAIIDGGRTLLTASCGPGISLSSPVPLKSDYPPISLYCPDSYQHPFRRTEVPPAFAYLLCCHNTSIPPSVVSRACPSSSSLRRPMSTTTSSPCKAYLTILLVHGSR